MESSDINNNENNIPKELEEEFNRYKIVLAHIEILACILMMLGYGVLIQSAKSDIKEIREKSKGLKITVDPATLTVISYNYILASMVLLYIVAVKRSEQRTLEIGYGIEVRQTDRNFKNIAAGYSISVIADVIRLTSAQNIADISGTIETLV